MASKPTQFDPLFQEAGSKYGVDPAILKAIASVESDFRPDAVGPRTRSGRAQGMMQFVPATAKAYGLDDPFDPAKSVDAAARLMRDNLKQFNGDLGKALEAYNGGPSLVGKSRQTAAYREKVMQRAQLARKDPKFKTQLAKTQNKAVSGRKLAPTPREALTDVSMLPASYKAALSLQYFTDTDPEGNPVDRAQEELERLLEEEQYAQAGPSGGGALLAKTFTPSEKEYVSPFDIMAGMQQPVEQEPRTQIAQVQGFADGGFVFGGTSLPAAPNWYLDPAADYAPGDREFIERNQQLLSGYNQAVEEYQSKVDQYNSLLDQWQKQAEEYNRQAEAWNAGPRTSNFNPTVKNPGEFNVKFEAKEPTLPFDPESFAAYVDLKNAQVEQGRKKVEREAPGRQLALDVIQDPGKYNLSGFGFKDGGDVNKRGMMERVGQWLKENEISPTDFLLATKSGFPLGLALQPSSLNANEEEMLAALRELQAERESGKVVGRAKGSGPLGEVPLLDEQGRVVREPQTVEEASLLEKIKGAGEAGLSVLSGMVSGPAGAAYGAFKGLTSDKYGTQAGVREAEAAAADVMKAGTYVPRGKVAPEYLQNIGQFLQSSKLDAALPETYAASAALRPGAVGQGIQMPVEQASTAMVRKITGNEALQPTDVYRAMADTKGIASLGAPAAAPTKINPGLFVSATEELDKFPVSSEVDNVLSAHIGGVGNLGDADAKYYLREVPGGPEYTQQSQAIAQKYFGDQFMGYRLMPKEEFEALKAGDVGDLLSFSLSKDAANAFRRFAPNQGREDLVLAEVPLTPRHVLGFGHRGEQELIVDTSVGWSLDDFKRASTPKQKEQVDRSLLSPSPERPFVGELERLVADLPGPVQKGQFLNSLKNKARGYEIRRVEEALEDFGSTDKVTPNQIMSALKRTSPQRLKLQVLQASDIGREGFSRDIDNPYPARPIGSVNLLLEPGAMQKQIGSIVEDIQDFRANKSTATVFGNDPTYIAEYAREVMNLADRVDEFDTQVARSVKMAAQDIASEARPIVDLALARRYVTTPGLDPKNKWLVNWNDPEKTVPQQVKDLLRKRGVTTLTPEVATMAAKEIETVNYLKELNKTINSGSSYATLLRNTLSGYERDMLGRLSSSPDALKIGLDDFYREASDPNKSQYMAQRMQDFATEVNGVLRDYDTVLNFGKNEVIKDLRNLTQGMLDSDTLQSGKLYEPLLHAKIAGKNPVSFARFVELNPSDIVDPPANLKPGEALLFTELQSDRRKDLFAGKRKGIEEPYPGFATDEDTASELMMKSAVAGAAQLNKKLVLFPGSDSRQPQIYGTWATEEAKKAKDMSQYSPSIMKRVSKKVAKDLGEGYEAREFKAINEAGDEVVRWGIVLPDDASNLPQKGIRFSKGGLVDKPLYDRA